MNTTKEPEFLAYHMVKRKFLPITDVETKKLEDIEIYEFSGQNFKLVINLASATFAAVIYQ